MLLVKLLGGSLKEQIAALLHDASHTAFSHFTDYVFNNHGQQIYHEKVKEDYLSKTEIPSILKKRVLNWVGILIEDKQHLILEQYMPYLYADCLSFFS